MYLIESCKRDFFLSFLLLPPPPPPPPPPPKFAGILKPYRGECLLDPPSSNAGPAGATEFTRWREVVRIHSVHHHLHVHVFAACVHIMYM